MPCVLRSLVFSQARLLETQISNSAYHGASMDKHHIALELEVSECDGFVPALPCLSSPFLSMSCPALPLQSLAKPLLCFAYVHFLCLPVPSAGLRSDGFCACLSPSLDAVSFRSFGIRARSVDLFGAPRIILTNNVKPP